MAEARDGIHRETDHLMQGILGSASKALMPLIRDRLLPKTNPGREASHKAMVLTHRDKRVHHASVQQTKITGITWDIHRSDTADQAIKGRGGHQLETRLTLALRPLSIDHLTSIFPASD